MNPAFLFKCNLFQLKNLNLKKLLKKLLQMKTILPFITKPSFDNVSIERL